MDRNIMLLSVLERPNQLGHKLLLSGHDPGQQNAAVHRLGMECPGHQLQRTGTGTEHQRRLILEGGEHIKGHIHPKEAVCR